MYLVKPRDKYYICVNASSISSQASSTPSEPSKKETGNFLVLVNLDVSQLLEKQDEHDSLPDAPETFTEEVEDSFMLMPADIPHEM